MAEPTAQNPQDSSGEEVKVPKWLEKAQSLAVHEEKGAEVKNAVSNTGAGASIVATEGAAIAVAEGAAIAKTEGASIAKPEEPALPETTPLEEVTFETDEKGEGKEVASSSLNEAEKQAPAAAGKTVLPEGGKEGVKIPDWLKKASEKAAGIVNPKVPAQSATSASPAQAETGIQPEITGQSGGTAPVPSTAGITKTAEKEVSVNSSITGANKTPLSAGNTKAPETTPATIQSLIPEKQKGEAVPEGLLETKKEEPMPEEIKKVQAAATPAPTAATLASTAATPTAGVLAALPAAPVKNSSKKDAFETAKKMLFTSMQKVNKAVDAGTTAGVGVSKEKEITDVSGKASKPADQKSGKGSSKEKSVSMEEKKKTLEAEKIYQEGLATVRDLIAPSSMEVKYDNIRVEGMYAQSFYVYAYPRYLDANWLSPIINFDVTMDIAQFIYPIESETIMRTLKKKVAQMQSSIRIAQEKGIVSDPAIETALQDAEELRTSIQRGQEKFFQFGLYFTIYSESEKKLKKISKQLESILGGKLILTKKAELQMEHGFNSCLPLCMDELEVSRNMNTSPLSSTFPFSSSDLTSNEGILYGLNRHNDSLIIFDRFSLENANSVVFAKSGAGKSYAIKLEILRSMMIGTDVIVIDPENEYEALAQTVGGSYLKVSLTADRRINPFDLPAALEGEDVQPGDLLRQNIITLNGLLKLMLGEISPQEESIIDKALIDVYALKGITMEVPNPAEFPPPTMEDLYDILSTSEGGMGLAQRLQKYTSGTYAGIFNKPTNVDLESGLMVFSIRDLEDALRPTAMYIILNYIWNRVRSKLKKRILVIDEAWSLMQHDDSAKFLFGLVKRARKYYLGITTITQDVEDFVKSPFGKPVITNSSMQILLKQAPAAIDMLGKIFDLTQGEKYMLINSGVGQGLFFAGMKHVAIQIIASYTEDKIVTTNPEEMLKARQSLETFETA